MKSFFKFLSKNKLYTAINLFGLAVSLMFVILIANYGSSMLGVDRFHENRDRIFLMGHEGGFSTNHGSFIRLQEMYPEIDKICGVAGFDFITYAQEDNKIKAFVLCADSTFFDMFSFPAISGDLSSALSTRDKAVVTQSYALKMFGTADAVGKTINVMGKNAQGEQTVSLIVSAVIKDLSRTILPLRTEIIIPFQNTKWLEYNDYYSPGVMINGGDAANKTFVMVKPGADLSPKCPEILKYLSENDMDYKLSERKEVNLVPLADVMMDPRNYNDGLEHGNRSMLMILLSAGIAILIFAVTNYINLTVAQTGFRAREMACRRLLGDTKKGIAWRLIGESTFITALAFAAGFILAGILQNYASTLCGEHIDIVKGLTPASVTVYLLFIILLGLITGIIPAYTLSQYKPIDIVRGTLRYRSKMIFSKVFMIIQNTITMVMLVCSVTIYLQINHLIKAPLEHNVDGIIECIDWKMTKSELSAFQNELRSLAFVENVGIGKNSSFFLGMRSMQGFTDKDGNEKWMTIMKLDTNGMNILGLKLLSDHQAASKAVYINEEAATQLGVGLEDTEFSIDYGNGLEKIVLGGILANFKLGNVLSDYPPIVISPMSSETAADSHAPGFIVYIKVSGDERAAYDQIVQTFTSVTSREPNGMINIAREYIAKNFSKERNTAHIILLFAIIAIIISALGLFAMSTYFTRQRIKEIGIRKIFGGTRNEILRKQLWSFVLPLLISIVIAIPIGWIIMDRWLQSYSYRISVYPWIFFAAGTFTIIIGILTVLGESLKAVNSNPIKAIRTE